MTEKHRFICEDSLDGIFTAVYDAWASRCGHDAVEISVREPENLEFFCQYHQIPSSSEKALKVARTLRQRLSVREYELICYAADLTRRTKAQQYTSLWSAVSVSGSASPTRKTPLFVG